MQLRTVLLCGGILALGTACGGAPTVPLSIPPTVESLALMRAGAPAAGCTAYDHSGGDTLALRCESRGADLVAFNYDGRLVLECDGVGDSECAALGDAIIRAGLAGATTGN